MDKRMGLEAGRILGGDDPLVGGLVRERGTGHEVADRVDAGKRRAQRAVDGDQAAVGEGDAGLLDAEVLDVRCAARGDHEPLGPLRLAGDGEGDAVAGRGDVLDEDAGTDRDALLLEAALGDLGDVGVLRGEDAVEALVERDVAAEAGVR